MALDNSVDWVPRWIISHWSPGLYDRSWQSFSHVLPGPG